MRLDGKMAVVIGKRISAICAENGAAIGLTGHDIVVSLSGFPQ
jgi:hypothetical protein